MLAATTISAKTCLMLRFIDCGKRSLTNLLNDGIVSYFPFVLISFICFALNTRMRCAPVISSHVCIKWYKRKTKTGCRRASSSTQLHALSFKCCQAKSTFAVLIVSFTSGSLRQYHQIQSTSLESHLGLHQNSGLLH